MKSYKFIYLIPLAFFFLAVGCTQEVLPEASFYTYEQTQCSDPWGNTNSSSELETLVADYLDGQSISVIESTVLVADGTFCSACNCPSGKTIYVKLSEADGQKLLGLNEGWNSD
ncbi:MAG: hypothetical protein R8P61_19135 [Bacteroidia bacterium]|nr:hypothetical protein [Bacteroidia bacterium]